MRSLSPNARRDDDRYRWQIAPELDEVVEPVPVLEAHVEEDARRGARREESSRGGQALHGIDGVAGLAHRRGEAVTDRALVVDDEDAHAAAPLRSVSTNALGPS